MLEIAGGILLAVAVIAFWPILLVMALGAAAVLGLGLALFLWPAQTIALTLLTAAYVWNERHSSPAA